MFLEINMITSKHIISLGERYKRGYRIGKDHVEVFINPDSSELTIAATDEFDKHSSGYLRFFADGSHKEVYVWGSRILHSGMSSALGYNTRFDNNDPHIFLGVAKVVGGRAVATESYNLSWRLETAENGNKESINFLKGFFLLLWDWLNTYIDCRNLLKTKYQEYLKIKK